jgi:hypothetical protein
MFPLGLVEPNKLSALNARMAVETSQLLVVTATRPWIYVLVGWADSDGFDSSASSADRAFARLKRSKFPRGGKPVTKRPRKRKRVRRERSA